MAVAAQEIHEAEHIGVGPVTDDDRARSGFDQAHAAQDQSAHDALAEIRLGDQ